LSDGSKRSGFYVSGALHAALLALLLVGFSQAPKFDDAAESIPVDTITQSQLNEIMHGERDAKPSNTPPTPPQRQLAAVDPTPPTPPEPPPDLRRVDGYPVLRRGLETSVPGLHMVGAPAAWSFGPINRFVSGSWFAGGAVAREIAGRASGRPLGGEAQCVRALFALICRRFDLRGA